MYPRREASKPPTLIWACDGIKWRVKFLWNVYEFSVRGRVIVNSAPFSGSGKGEAVTVPL